MILFLTKDLLAQSQAAGAAKQNGAVMKCVADLDQATALLADENASADALIVDLQTPGLIVEDLIQVLSGLEQCPTTIAFAQHVQVELLASAESECIDQLLTRGQFVSQLPKIFTQITRKQT